jgi:glucose-6-phosphate 1-dehydrogenase
MLPGFNPQLLHGQVELILACMQRIDPREVRLGQYEGYTEPGKPNYELDRKIPTGILFPMFIDNEKWGTYSGHPRNGHNGGNTKIYFHSAKAMPEDRKRIIRLARHVPAAMISQDLRANFNVVNFEPIFHQWGVTNVRDPKAGKFSTLPSLWKMCNPLQAPSRLEVLLEAYTNLLAGNLAWLDTIKTSAMVMSILTPLYEAWKAGEIPIEKYPPGTWWPGNISPLNYLPVDPTQEDIIRGYAAHDEWKRAMLAGRT